MNLNDVSYFLTHSQVSDNMTKNNMNYKSEILQWRTAFTGYNSCENWKSNKKGSIYPSINPFIHLSVYPSIHPFIYLSIHASITQYNIYM